MLTDGLGPSPPPPGNVALASIVRTLSGLSSEFGSVKADFVCVHLTLH